MAEPSPFVCRAVRYALTTGTALDLAAGSGRHGRMMAAVGFTVTAVDRDVSGLDDFYGDIIEADLEGASWPLAGQSYDLVCVVNYLHRPRFAALVDLVSPGGLLIYETFMRGQERLGRPQSPDFLLNPGELLDLTRHRFLPLRYESGPCDGAIKQKLVARRKG